MMDWISGDIDDTERDGQHWFELVVLELVIATNLVFKLGPKT